MNKLSVGDYVRTRWGCIAKFEGINEGFYEFDNIIMDESSAVREELFVNIVEKSSPDIIDLIEVGDYVNGRKVSKINLDKTLNKEKCILCADTNYDCLDTVYKNEDIKSIVTHEQMEAMQYRVEE